MCIHFTGFQHSNIGKETEIQTNAVCGGVINVPDVEIEKDKEPERTEKSETDTGVSAKRMVKQVCGSLYQSIRKFWFT